MMALKIYSAPAVEPVSLGEAKLHLRVDGSDDDALILDLIKTARVDVETISLHKLITQTWDYYLDGFPGESVIELPYPPLQSVTGVYYTPDGGTETTFASTHYTVDIYNEPGRIYLTTTTGGGQGYWPTNTLIPYNGVRIRFVCGYGAGASAVDVRAIQAMKLLLGHYYENREAVFMGRTTPSLLPMGVQNLCWDLRASVKEF
jgi:uncharacterized phiE125 gp8 family phage protein